MEANSLELLCKSTDIYNQDNPVFPSELKTVQTFYEQYFLKMGLPITYLGFRLENKDSQRCREFTEPDWDAGYWLEKETEGRTPGRIR